jgi:hypothetical protein
MSQHRTWHGRPGSHGLRPDVARAEAAHRRRLANALRLLAYVGVSVTGALLLAKTTTEAT